MLNYNFLLLFLLAHLTGDYILQTNKIFKMKSEGLKGVAIHTLIVGLVQVVLLSCYGIRGIIAGVIGTVIHFGIDELKLIIVRQSVKKELLIYLFDQGLHFLVLVLLTLFLAPDSGWVEKYTLYIRILTAAALLFGMAVVTAKTVVRSFFKEVGSQMFFLGKERWWDTLTVAIVAVIAVLPAVVSITLPVGYSMAILGVIPYGRLQKKAYHYDRKVFMLKYITLLIFATLAGWIVRGGYH